MMETKTQVIAPSLQQRNRTAAVSPGPHSSVLGQRLGNSGLQQLLHARVLQAKLSVSDPNDACEHEAERVADAVMRSDNPAVQRVCNGREEPLRRQAVNEAMLQMRSPDSGEPSQVDPALEASIGALAGRGSALPEAVRSYMEPRFNADFSAVRVHTDATAQALARSVNAQAFTLGKDVVFGAGYYTPGTDSGRRLLAHELTHVVQQSGPGRPTSAPPQAAPTALQRQAESTVPATHEVEIWVDYNNTLKKQKGTPGARGPSSALYVEDLRMVPNVQAADPKGLHLSGINVASSGGAKLGAIRHPEADGLVSGVVSFGTPPAVRLDAAISYLDDDPYEPLSEDDKKRLAPTMKEAKRNAAKVAQKALSKVGDADESAIKAELVSELRTTYPGLDFTVVSLAPQGKGESFSLPSIPYDAVTSDRIMKLWVNVPSVGFTHRYDYEVLDKKTTSKEDVKAKSTTDISKDGGSSSVSTVQIEKAIKVIKTELKTQIYNNRDVLKTENKTVTWKASAGFKETLKGSLGAEGKATFDPSSLLPVSKIPLVGKYIGKLVPKLPIELKLKGDGSAEFEAKQDVSRESISKWSDSDRNQVITDWQNSVDTSLTEETYKELRTTVTAFWERYHKIEDYSSSKDVAAAEAATRKGGQSVSITYQALQPFLTIGGPAQQQPEVVR